MFGCHFPTGTVEPFESLVAWQKAHTLFLAVYRITAGWPRSELYGMVSQARRAAFSVPANIAEGQARFGAPEFKRHVSIALGSLAELKYSLRAAKDLGWLADDEYQRIHVLAEEASRCGYGLLRSIQDARTNK
ncbi:MAG TPA: four helix bundle protein [Gemmatimonadales bacterium]|nr:four helix bundle protein [Gemmatimonadales bacterium]